MKAIILLLFTVVAASFAEELDLDEIEKELQESPLEEVDPALTDDRKRFIFGWLFRRACSCDKISCQCCAKPRIFGAKIEGCVKLTAKPETDEIIADVNALGKNVLTRAFPMKDAGEYCGHLPGKASFLSYCFKTTTTGDEQTGLTFCSQLEVNVKTTVAVSANFRCIELKDGKISFSENKMPSKNGILNLVTRNVFKKVVDFIKKP